MNIERLEYFSTLAAYLNYSKAAEQLFITQPALSKQIARLEQDLGVSLFHRNHHSVTLTEEGEECLAYVRPLLHYYMQLQNWANAHKGEGHLSSLRIGYYGTLLRDIVLAVTDGILQRFPAMNVSLKNYSPGNVAMALKNDLIDLAILREVYCDLLDDICTVDLCRISQYLLVPEKHRLASKEKVGMKELEGEVFVALIQKDSPQGHNDMIKLCKKYGLNPVISHVCDDANSYYMNIRSGGGVGIAHAFSHSTMVGIKYVALDCRKEDLDSVVKIVWKKNRGLGQDEHLISCVHDIAKSIGME